MSFIVRYAEVINTSLMKEDAAVLGRLLEARGWTWAEFGRRIKATDQRLNNWKKRGIPAAQRPSVAAVLGMSLDEMHAHLSGLKRPALEPTLATRGRATREGRTLLPIQDVEVAAGAGTLVGSENLVGYLELDTQLLRQHVGVADKHLAVIFVRGDSMAETLQTGDMILVDQGVTQLSEDGVYVCRLDGMLVVKRLQRLPKSRIRVVSDNARYKPFDVNPGRDGLEICGRVVWAWHGVKF